MKKCFCGGSYTHQKAHGETRCSRDDCPRLLGGGSWHLSLPFLQALYNINEYTFTSRWPDFDLAALENHVESVGRRVVGYRTADQDRGPHLIRKEDRPLSSASPVPQAKRAPRAARRPLLKSSSSSSTFSIRAPLLPLQQVRIESETDLDDTTADAIGAVPTGDTAPDSDSSGSSLFNLRSKAHDISDVDELSDVSSQASDEAANAIRERVEQWRLDTGHELDEDFAFRFMSFEDAYANTDEDIARSWVKVRTAYEPSIIMDLARIEVIEGTLTKIRKIDSEKKAADEKWAKRMKPSIKVSTLRKQGKGTEKEETPADKIVFINPLASLMMECNVGRADNQTSTDADLMDSLTRKATRLVSDTSIPTMQRAITTIEELKAFLASKYTHMGVSNLEPIALEKYLFSTTYSTRALASLSWICNNLHLGWPLESIEKPVSKKTSLIGMECKQAPLAQPSMIQALALSMEAAAKTGDVMWLAYFASYVQTMGNLRLMHVLRRSIPVEQYIGWMIFFCKRGKQKHQRNGFYWGVPTETPNGWNWATKFIHEYEVRRAGAHGKEMMGMIFRTDNQEFIAMRTVNAMTMEVIKKVVENPEDLTTYSWRRVMPTVALHLKLTAPERLAVGDWQDAKKISDEAPITLRYADQKRIMSRTSKSACSFAIASLIQNNIGSFEEVTAQQWTEIAAQARTAAEPDKFSTKVLWHNPDVKDTRRGFRLKSDRHTFPKHLSGFQLLAVNKTGDKFCAAYQRDSCSNEEPCHFGLHSCAARISNDRACQGLHPGAKCYVATKRAAASHAELPSAAGGNPVYVNEGPAKKKARVMVQTEHADFQQSASASPQPHVEDASIMEALLPDLRHARFSYRGNRSFPEPPRMVAKVCSEKGKGELWLGSLPTSGLMEAITRTTHSIQVHCFKKHPETQYIDKRARRELERGIHIPGTLLLRCEMSNDKMRPKDIRSLRSIVVNSIRQGDNVYVHCISGVTRAPIAAGILVALLLRISFRAAEDIISQVRNVDNKRHLRGDWINKILREDVPILPVPTGFSCSASGHMSAVVHATIEDGDGLTQPICRWKRGLTRSGSSSRHNNGFATTSTIENAFNNFSGKFCATCLPLIKASSRMQVELHYGQRGYQCVY